MKNVMPVYFLGHGNPMNAVLKNKYTETWRQLGEALPKPKAILMISAHWFIQGTAVTAMSAPRTIHDFAGFPPQLQRFQYPAPGDPRLAHRVQELLHPVAVKLDQSWGLDHGTWSVLCHLFPEADIPLVQLSIDETKPASFHYNLGRRLSPLRDEGVLIMGSGNLVHNLHAYAWGVHSQEPFDWAVRFESKVQELLVAGKDDALVDYESWGPDAELAVPTPEHYLPLLYAISLRRPGDRVTFPVEGVDGGSISMLSVQVSTDH